MKRARILILSLAALLVVIATVAVVLLNREYSSEALGQAVLSYVNNDDMTVAAEEYRFQPLSGLEMRGVTVDSVIPDGRMVARIEKLTVSHQLAPLLRGQVVFHEIVLDRPAFQVIWETPPEVVEVEAGTTPAASTQAETETVGQDPAAGEASGDAGQAESTIEPVLAITRFAMVDGALDMQDAAAPEPYLSMESFDVELRDFEVASGAADFLNRLACHGDLSADRLVTEVTESTDVRGKVSLEDAHVLISSLTMPVDAGNMLFELIDVDLNQEPFTYAVSGAGVALATHKIFGASSGFGPANLVLEMSGAGTATDTASGSGSLSVGAGTLGDMPMLGTVEQLLVGSSLIGRSYEPFEIRFTLGEDRLAIEPFHIVSGDMQFDFGGAVALAGGLDLQTTFALPRAGLEIDAVPKEVLEALTDVDGRVKLPILIGGTAEGPKPAFDQRAWGQLLGRRLAREAEKELTKALGRLFGGGDESDEDG